MRENERLKKNRRLTKVQRTIYVSGRETNDSEEEEEVFVMHSMPDIVISKIAPLTMTLAVGLNEIQSLRDHSAAKMIGRQGRLLQNLTSRTWPPLEP